jgi:acyl-CoA synthetase (AMP-forming)/AMP-acid ligase II
MPYKSPYPDIDIPKTNILTYIFGDGKSLSTKPQWIDASDPSHSLSPAQMVSWVKRFAVGLDRMGIPEAVAIMVFCPNHIFVPMAYLAAAGSKRYFTGANPGYTANEVAHQMKAVDAAVVLIHPSMLETGVAAAKQAGVPLDRTFQFSDRPTKTSPEGIKDWRSMVASEKESESWMWDPLEGEASVNTVCAINFSSGTTGLPKGVCITHHNLIANASQAAFNKYDTEHSKPKDPNETWLAMLPLYHAYSQLWTINIAGKLGIPVYVMEKFVFEDFLKYIEKYKVSALQTVPPVAVMLSKRPETTKYDLSSLKHMLCGAAPLSKEIQNDVSGKLNCVIAQGWGMTETTCIGFLIPGNMHDDSGSIGHVIANTEVQLMGEDGKEVLNEEVPGEVWVRGPQIMKGYWKNERATRETKDEQGWLHTGDVGIRRGNMFWIVDRMKELIKVNGLQVAPAELEAVLLENDAVADAAAVGVTIHGEELPRAYVVLQPGFKDKVSEQDIQKFVAGKVSKHKRLAGGVKFVDEVPKLPSGKIVRKQMKEWAKRDSKELEGQIKARL